QSPTLALAKVSGLSTAEFTWDFIPECRGEYPLVTPRLVTGFPFGLRHASRPMAVQQTILVWPRIVDLDTLLDAAESRPSDDTFSEQRVGDSGDMTGTRPFRNGDSLRRVHWAQTARLGRMIVCERQAPAQASVRVVFETDPRMHAGSGRDSTLEWTIRLAASVCAAYQREHGTVECSLGREILMIEAGTLGWQRFLDRLARFRPATDAERSSQDAPVVAHRRRPINDGAFQIAFMTDIELAHGSSQPSWSGDQRVVLLDSKGFGGLCPFCNQPHPTPSRRAIAITDAQSVFEDFQRKWRHACHVG
ncbi:MAG: hypothetical protein B7Z55_14710, partial [Planctomycetales bacterium 12-60-4]